MRIRSTVLIEALLLTALVAQTAAWGKARTPKAPGPLSAGPFAVGVTTEVFVDSSRVDNLTKKPRTLVTEIWYPATDDARSQPKNRYSDFIPGGVTAEIDELTRKAYKIGVADIDKIYWNEAVRDAKVRKGRFPLVIFSHGNGGSRHQNTFWCDYLASHGYVVVSPDHTGNARMTILDGKPVPAQASERGNSAKDRPRDLSFLLDRMIAWDKADKRFAGRIATDRACAAGMSFGSYTAITVADLDNRFKAVIGMAFAPPSHTNLTVPSLQMLGTEDKTIGAMGNYSIRNHHAKHLGPSYLLELKNGGHFSFTDMFKINKSFGDGVGRGRRRDTNEAFEFTPMEPTYKIINSYSVAFLGYYLKGQKEYLSFLRENHWPDLVIWEAKNAGPSAETGKQKRAEGTQKAGGAER